MSSWNLISLDQIVAVSLEASGDNGQLSGTLTFEGKNYPVNGGWDASGSIPGRNFSAFSLSGRTQTQPDVPDWISAAGIMTGPGDKPTQIEIRLSVSSSSDGTLRKYSGVLYDSDVTDERLGTFDHVVVLMLENRSFDNLLGYLYPNGVPANAPLGKSFEGIATAEKRLGKPLSNPFPADRQNPPPAGKDPIPVSPVEVKGPNQNDLNKCYQPYPDPGETYEHVNTQLFNLINGGDKPPYNLPPGSPEPNMQGFVTDYIENYSASENFPEIHNPTYDQYRQIMQCYTPSQVPVITTLAEQFGVFDHWFCAVPSQTWCNRAFWNAGTSWGRVVNGPSLTWLKDSIGDTIFNQIHRSSSLNWNVYSDNPFISMTTLIHTLALDAFHSIFAEHFHGLGAFKKACQSGQLPAYSFVEPKFMTPTHNDYHPSSHHAGITDVDPLGPSVLLGELLLWNVYEWIRTSPARDRTLFVITFDEHGGCYDHVPPPPKVTPPDLTGYDKEDGFNFDRLGVRVPTIMVSSHIARNTVVNTPMHHCSFLKTVEYKWDKAEPGKFPPLTPRVATAPAFTEVFTSEVPRPVTDWPVIPKPVVDPNFWSMDFSQVPLTKFERQILDATTQLPQVQAETESRKRRGSTMPEPESLKTVGDALEYLRSIPGLVLEEESPITK
ncbi:MAG: alkaline phosphatase family protein [Blastocatellia bacterium]